MSGPRRRQRLDAELVRRGLARSRQQAGELVAAGVVTVRGQRASKPATQVELADPIVVSAAATSAEEGDRPWASRGAHKLLGALAAFPDVVVGGRRALDAGASTGGFTDVLLRRGATHVLAVDVGYGQLAWSVRTDERVTVLDRTNVRALTPEQVLDAAGVLPDLVVSDLSFISLRLVVPALAACCAPAADLLLMVKPQFEVGRERLGSGGVVRDPARREEAVLAVAGAAQAEGLQVLGVAASPLPGPSGNVEYFLRLREGRAAGAATSPREPVAGSGAPVDGDELRAQVARAVAEGPTGARA